MIVPSVPDERRTGNTMTSSISPAKHWFFTFNHYEKEDIDYLLTTDCSIVPKFVFQEEKGKSGTPHLQGYIMFASKQRPMSFFKGTNWGTKVHWEKVKSVISARKYCQKVDTRNGEVYRRGVKEITPPKTIRFEDFKPWQKDLFDKLSKEPDDRTIHWVCDVSGGAGKSAFVKYMCVNEPNKCVMVGGKASDIKYAIYSMKVKPSIVFIDLPRSFNKEYLSYHGIEEVKNGCFFNTKYESGMCVFDSPHIVILSNEMPDEYKLTADRWNIIEL